MYLEMSWLSDDELKELENSIQEMKLGPKEILY